MVNQNELNRLVRIARKLKARGDFGDSQIILEVVKKFLKNDEKLIDKWNLL